MSAFKILLVFLSVPFFLVAHYAGSHWVGGVILHLKTTRVMPHYELTPKVLGKEFTPSSIYPVREIGEDKTSAMKSFLSRADPRGLRAVKLYFCYDPKDRKFFPWSFQAANQITALFFFPH